MTTKKRTQNKKQNITREELVLNRNILFVAGMVPVLVVAYLFMIYSSTATAYEIEQKEKTFAYVVQDVSVLEADFYAKKRSVAKGNVSEYGLVSINNPQYVTSEPQIYSLANASN